MTIEDDVVTITVKRSDLIETIKAAKGTGDTGHYAAVEVEKKLPFRVRVTVDVDLDQSRYWNSGNGFDPFSTTAKDLAESILVGNPRFVNAIVQHTERVV